MHADTDGAVRIARLVDDFDWTWNLGDFARFASSLNWRIESQNDHGAQITTNLQVNRQRCEGYASTHEFPVYIGPTPDITYISVPVTDAAEPDMSEADVEGILSRLSAQLTGVLGEPAVHYPDSNMRIGWYMYNAALFLAVSETGIDLEILNPQFYLWWSEGPIDFADEDDEDI
ncbi:DUF6301 family protein [Nocardia tengchongensis]|uniref:DUF6301 family protein n=1 Tax=Nocardia tengchongensis TaxID=2055889 RepID=UPI0036AE5E72